MDNCPSCGLELRIAKVIELADRYLQTLTCGNPQCPKYKEALEEKEILKDGKAQA